MNREEIIKKYPPRKVASQVEFDLIMNEMNAEQTHLNAPYLDRERELAKKRAMLEAQKWAINTQLDLIRIERCDLEQKRKDINRLFHDLKHELIMLNPKNGIISDAQLEPPAQ